MVDHLELEDETFVNKETTILGPMDLPVTATTNK